MDSTRKRRTCAKCRQSIPAKMASQPRINSAMVFAIRMVRASHKNNNNGGVRPFGAYQSVHNQDKPDQPYTTDRAQTNGRANAASGKIFVTVPLDHFGPITAQNDPIRNQGLLVGESWPDRQECRRWGAHFIPIGGICGQSNHGAQSVFLSGGYIDDEDHGEWFLYTGSGGKDLSGNKRTIKEHSSDQKFERCNRALLLSCLNGYPVRVVRSHIEKRSSYAPESGVRYDGIYRIEKCWQVAGKQVAGIYSLDVTMNLPLGQVMIVEIDPDPCPLIRELKKGTTIHERTETPSWDFDEEDSYWKWKKPPPPSRKKVQTEEYIQIPRKITEIRKFQKMSIKGNLRTGFSCLICRQVMVSPVTTPCGHNCCKSCLEGAFAGQAFVKERSWGGRKLRSQKNVMKCPACHADISDCLQNLQVDIHLRTAIESLKAKAEENGESVESGEEDEDATGSRNKNSVEELNGSPEGSDMGELKVTKKAPNSAVKRNAKRKKTESSEQLPEMGDVKMSKKGKKSRKAEKAVDEENDSPSIPSQSTIKSWGI